MVSKTVDGLKLGLRLLCYVTGYQITEERPDLDGQKATLSVLKDSGNRLNYGFLWNVQK